MKLRSLALGSVAAISLVAGGAMAADLPVRSAAPAPVYAAPIFTWTGFYVGLNAGWVGFKSEGGSTYWNDNCFFQLCGDRSRRM